ncbi:hypothetical protein [Roseomonas genomospecies 6]|uniref:Uncharacterized protein n=1 Tax=Roseomonas genomospecies 6 TaxID=214106 RepID=A0A9W7NDS0_9PROT|nr:hypothetical protein [Roseomonas genomospecies 6]KAA0675777.1 hypothetical protein DS843_30085 [Roseomonas genomospecies 6]
MLKEADAAVAGVLAAAAPLAGCDLHLALLSIDEHGAADYADSYRGSWRRRDESDDALEAGEVYERVASLSDWRRPDGAPSPLEAIPVEEKDEVSPPEALDDVAPDEDLFHEATGNAGATFGPCRRLPAFIPTARPVSRGCSANRGEQAATGVGVAAEPDWAGHRHAPSPHQEKPLPAMQRRRHAREVGIQPPSGPIAAVAVLQPEHPLALAAARRRQGKQARGRQGGAVPGSALQRFEGQAEVGLVQREEAVGAQQPGLEGRVAGELSPPR